VERRDSHLDEALRRRARYLVERLTPTSETVPRVPGIDIHGVTLPLCGVSGGDRRRPTGRCTADGRLHARPHQRPPEWPRPGGPGPQSRRPEPSLPRPDQAEPPIRAHLHELP